jgi:arylsulfatase A-like enzyme
MFLLAFAALHATAVQQKPNLIFLLVDELGHNNVAWSNGSAAKMPHIAKLYKGSIGLTQHYVQRWCTPTRASLMTVTSPVPIFVF